MQTNVGLPTTAVEVSHTFAVKLLLLAETMSTPVTVYPSSFVPVVNACATRRWTFVTPSAL